MKKRERRLFDAAVEAEVERRRLAHTFEKPISYRTLTVNFEERRITLGGHGSYTLKPEHAAISIPLLSTEQPIFPLTDWERGAPF